MFEQLFPRVWGSRPSNCLLTYYFIITSVCGIATKGTGGSAEGAGMLDVDNSDEGVGGAAGGDAGAVGA
jgi:hypothetical protein